MKFSASLALAALAIGQASAGILNHRRFHMRRDAQPAPVHEKRDVLSAAGAALLSAIGMTQTGSNAASNNGNVWLGADGPYTWDFINESGKDIVIVLWGPMASWVNANKPLITTSLPAGSVQTISFANGASGAFAPIYPDTKMNNFGMIAETWGEFTFNGQYTTIDVSREVNMNGHKMKLVDAGGCVSDFENCVFQCKGGVASCLTGYELFNCQPGSQFGAQIGQYDGADTGGCSGFGTNPGGKLTATFY